MLLTVLLALFGVREGLRLSLIGRVGKSLLDDAVEVSLAVKQFYPDLDQVYKEMNRKVEGHEDRDLFVQFLSAGGQVLWSSDNTPPLDHIAIPSADDQTPWCCAIPNYRLAQRRIEQAGVPAYTVRVGSSLNMVEEDVATLTHLITAPES